MVRKEVCLKSGAWEQSPEVGDEDRVYEPSVGDEVERNGNGDGWWGRSSCVRACDGRLEDQKMYSHLNTTRLYNPKNCKE